MAEGATVRFDHERLGATEAWDAGQEVDLPGIVEGMAQGLLVWDDNERCVMFTKRVLDILELVKDDISVGMKRTDFLQGSIERGEIEAGEVEKIKSQFTRRNHFKFDRTLGSKRIVSTMVRPRGERGFVVTFSDVTSERRKSRDLDALVQAADEARSQLAATLKLEQARQYESRVIGDFGEWLQTCKSLDELYDIVAKFLSQTLPDSQGELYIYSNSRDVLDGVLSWGEASSQDFIQPDSCWGLRRGRSYHYNEDQLSFECPHVADVSHPEIHEYNCIPIVAHGDTVGLLHIRYDKAPDCAAIADRYEFIVKCGELVSLAIANVRLRDELHEQSTRDPLTGLNNRRFCLETLRTQIGSFARVNKPFSIIAFDADKFKQFNDNFGHDAGDCVLQSIAEEMRKESIPGQISCRFGGEEFLIILPETGMEKAMEIADDLRKRVQSIRISYANQVLPGVTISCGVATYPDTSDGIQGLLKEADVALFRAKRDGRNRVEAAK